MTLVKITLPLEVALDYRNMDFCKWLLEKEEDNLIRFNTRDEVLNIIFDLKNEEIIKRVCQKAVNNLKH